MQNINLKQLLSQKLSSKQIQFIKLLQASSLEIDSKIEDELNKNPILIKYQNEKKYNLNKKNKNLLKKKYKINTNNNFNKLEYNTSNQYSFYDKLIEQLNFLNLNKKEYIIGKNIIGNIDNNGYIKRNLKYIIKDLIVENIKTDINEIDFVLKKIQKFKPTGIASKNLKECLLIQIKNKKNINKFYKIAFKIIKIYFKEFIKKKYKVIIKKLNILNINTIKKALQIIIKLNPKPGNNLNNIFRKQVLYPDFIIKKKEKKIEIFLNQKNTPNIKINKNYLEKIEKNNYLNKKITSFIRNKIELGKWFINAINQRQKTLLLAIQVIIDIQNKFFLKEENESKLKPMILKDIAKQIKMNISTISRIIYNKSIQTNLNIYTLKFFFSDKIKNIKGIEISNKIIKNKILKIIKNENNKNPNSDRGIALVLKKINYKISRRTVSKYRQKLNIPISRLRKKLY